MIANRLVQPQRPLAACRRLSTPKTGRTTVVSFAALQDPYSTLGVGVDADERVVKKAFRKMALKHHPDVAKEPGTEVKFLKLTEAYEFIMRKLRGGHDVDDHFEKAEDSWDFHDWYWNFRIRRNWAKQAQQQHVDELVDDSAQAQQQQRSHEAGYKTKEIKQQVQSQLAGLRQRSAVRAYRASMSTMESDSDESDSEDIPMPCSASARNWAKTWEKSKAAAKVAVEAASRSAAAETTCIRNLSGHVLEEGNAPAPAPSKVEVNIFPPKDSTDNWGAWDLGYLHDDDIKTTASFDALFGGQGQEHDAFHKRHMRRTKSSPSSSTAATNAYPTAAASSVAHDASFGASIGAEFDTASDCTAAGASSGHGFGQQFKQRPKFAASHERREAVVHQLAGLKRKAAISKQHA